MPDDSDGVGRYETARRFLDSLFGQAEGASILVWTVTPTAKLSHWPESIDAAARFAASADTTTNVYVGCGWREKPLGAHARGARANVAGIPALWVDLDVAGDGHSAKPYPPSFEDARALVRALPIPPSTIVNSGGGLHLWWRFREPWAFETEGERADAEDLVRRWEATVQQHAAERGYVLDSVHDLSRVLRIPGTWRTKQSDPVPRFVDIEADNGATYLREDFEPFLVTDIHGAGRQTIAPRIEIGSVVLRTDAQPPVEKLIILREIEPRFEATWLHKRPDLKDGSESSYDLAVANYAAQAEWTDQEIADLIIARRRNCKADVTKALRLDYIRDRIRHARVSVAASRVAADVQVREDIKTVEQEQTLTEMDATVERGGGSTEILAYLSDMFGVQVVRWTQATRHQGYYELHVTGGPAPVIAIGDVESVANQKRFQNAVYMHTGRRIGPFKPADWERILRALGSVVEVSDTGTSSRTGQMLEWLEMYASDAPDLTEFDFEMLRSTQSFRRKKSLYIHAGSFLKWIGFQGVKMSKSELLATMKLVGFEMVRVDARNEVGLRVCRAYWTAPPESLSGTSEPAA